MKGEDLFNALGKIDDSLIDEAMNEKNKNSKSIFKWAVGIAACLCLLLTVGSYVRSVTMIKDKVKLNISTIIFEPMGLGYEGTDDLSLENSDDINPWTKDAQIEKLPVYRNLCYNSGKLSQRYYSADDLKKQAEEFADYMGLDILGGETVNGEDEGEVYCYIMQTKQGQVTNNGTGFSFTVNEGYEYLIEKHVEYNRNSKNELVSGIYREYTVDDELLSQEKRSYYKSGDIVEDIVTFNLQSYYVSVGDNYTSSRSKDFISSAESFGEYPIITWKQAQKKLLKGEYVSSADESQIIGGKLTKESIADVDLIYYTGGNPELYVPYYRFYVKYYSGGSDNQRYAYFYVCAIDDRYLNNNETSE